MATMTAVAASAPSKTSWRTWTGQDVARFVSSDCELPQYAEIAARSLTGDTLGQLVQAGLLSKGLARAGIQDFDHVTRIAEGLRELDQPPGIKSASKFFTTQVESGRQTRRPKQPQAPALQKRVSSSPALLDIAAPGLAWNDLKRRRAASVAKKLPPLGRSASESGIPIAGKSRRDGWTAVWNHDVPVACSVGTPWRPTAAMVAMTKSVSGDALTVPYFSAERQTPDLYSDPVKRATPSLYHSREEAIA
eukprot:TRINITY_DN34207_c0_g1_i1.p1 TRINITY_DN34207_c0_g1~~TRINITY_DN34207_c0_g1_i1.p1  ORF type:complete len:277 (+),score=37.40 TRINITY_DN34207_c0_g1_i1:86-832(+)